MRIFYNSLLELHGAISSHDVMKPSICMNAEPLSSYSLVTCIPEEVIHKIYVASAGM